MEEEGSVLYRMNTKSILSERHDTTFTESKRNGSKRSVPDLVRSEMKPQKRTRSGKLIVSRQKCYCTMNLSDWALCQRTNGKWSIYPMWYQTIVHNRFLSQVNEQVGPLIHRLTPKYIDLVKVANSKECELSLLKNLRRIINENKCAACQRARNASTTKITFPTNGNQQTLENPIDWLNNHVWFNLFSEPRNDNVIKMRFVNSDDITQKTFTDVREDDYKQINAKIKEIRQKNFVRQYMYTK
ncbi:unnamed protein product [Schistosoma intercalatum]|nr:unnamed protein product [Schistosoma intercalatum]